MSDLYSWCGNLLMKISEDSGEMGRYAFFKAIFLEKERLGNTNPVITLLMETPIFFSFYCFSLYDQIII